MSKHWQPDAAHARQMDVDSAPRKRPPWPAGATIGLLLVAAACFGLGAAVYLMTGPRDVFGP